MLGVVVCFGMVYFSYGAFHDYSYGFGDMYRHHSWIYGLLNGTPFYEGIYPEAMHCFIYAMRVLFGVKIYSSQLFLAGIHVAVFLVSAYLLLKELFAWDGTAVLALALFLTVDLCALTRSFPCPVCSGRCRRSSDCIHNSCAHCFCFAALRRTLATDPVAGESGSESF